MDMKEILTDEMRQIQLAILQFIDRTCRENNIEYSLGGGSLLGAIRHKGFIPWDDDIDIMLRRDEYERLIDVLSPNNSNSQYKLWHYSNRATYQPCAKLYDNRTILGRSSDHMWTGVGVHVDIFPMDILPSDELERTNFMKQMQSKAEDLVSTGFPAFVSGSKWEYAIARFFLRAPRFLKYHGKNKEIALEYDNMSKKYDHTQANEIGFLASRYFDKEHFPKKLFDDYEDTVFENLKPRKIKNHSRYLKQIFGDFMQLPPENKRVTHDFYTWYWKED